MLPNSLFPFWEQVDDQIISHWKIIKKKSGILLQVNNTCNIHIHILDSPRDLVFHAIRTRDPSVATDYTFWTISQLEFPYPIFYNYTYGAGLLILHDLSVHVYTRSSPRDHIHLGCLLYTRHEVGLAAVDALKRFTKGLR